LQKNIVIFSGYKFYDKDGEQNIIVEKQSGNGLDVIVAGTLPKLVERLTYEKYPGHIVLFKLSFDRFKTLSCSNKSQRFLCCLKQSNLMTKFLANTNSVDFICL